MLRESALEISKITLGGSFEAIKTKTQSHLNQPQQIKAEECEWLKPPIRKDLYGGFLSHGGTPSHSPFYFQTFREICHPANLGYPPMAKEIFKPLESNILK